MSDDTSSHVRVSHVYDELLFSIIVCMIVALETWRRGF